MSARYEGTVIINGNEEVVEMFILLFQEAHEAMDENGYFEYNNKSYEFCSEEGCCFIESRVYSFDFTDSGSLSYNHLMSFLEDATNDFKGLSFDIVTLYEYGEDYDVMTIAKGKIKKNTIYTKLMKKLFKSFDWDTQCIPEFISHLTKLIQNEPTLTNE